MATHPQGRWTSIVGLCAGLAWGCGEDGRAGDNSGGDEGQADAADDQGVDEGVLDGVDDEGVEAGASGDDEGVGRLDVAGTGGLEGGDGRSGCNKVDFLFFIDSSGSMQDEQTNLLNSFPGFVSAITEELEIDDFQLMVVDAGDPTGGGIGECGAQLGHGRVKSGDNVDCGLPEGKRYVTAAGASDLATTFECLGNVGTQGPSDEQIVGTVLAAVGEHAQPGECNAGFVRDDAVLVVTIIADEEDSPSDPPIFPGLPPDGSCRGADSDANSPGVPGTWKQDLLAAKGGREDHVVVLSIVGDCDLSDGTCEGMRVLSGGVVSGAEPAPRLRQFAELFTHHRVGSVCAEDYSPFFAEAAGLVTQVCEQFNPG